MLRLSSPPIGAGPQRPSLVSAALLTALLPLPALGQSPNERVLAFEESARGLTLMGSVEQGVLQQGQERLISLQLDEGDSYLIVAFCDADCTDLDLALLDPSGREVGSDLLPDAEPILSFTAEASGLFQLRVAMVTCAVEPCKYAVGTYAGRSGTPLLTSPGMDATILAFREETTRDGYVDLGEMERGALDQDQEMRFPVRLQEGVEYRFLGACDQDCEDLDMRLFDPEGAEVDADLRSPAVALLEVTPSVTAEYRLAVIMASCSLEPCSFQIVGAARGETVGPGGAEITGTVVVDTTHWGMLSSEDEKLREGEYYEEFQLQVQEGQRIIVDLRSSDFDTYLILEAPGGEAERNDDYEDDMQHSHIEMVARESGIYSILVTTFSAGATGSYVLRAVVTEGS